MREIGKAVLQYSHCTYDTARALGERAHKRATRGVQAGVHRRRRAGALGTVPTIWRWGACDTASWGLRHGAGLATTQPHVRGLCALAGPDWVLGAPDSL